MIVPPVPVTTVLVVLATTPTTAVDYARDVKPILKSHCYACHGVLQQKGKLRLDTAELLRRGGKHGQVVIPGKSADSPLLARVRDTEDGMPPKGEGERLSDKQVALLRAWIDQGAPAPAGEKPEPDPREHWAFRPPERPPVPAVNLPGWGHNPIDAFLAAELAKRGLTPSPPCDRATWLRRVSLDLTGLPPTRAELLAFLADPAADAYEKVVDRLLASPQYGERWARHWLDVWRYSDWYGRRMVPDVWNSAPQVWRWRDWVVRSLNEDRGYDRMVQEMLAADEIDPENDEAVVATGYIVRNWYALNPNQWLRDQVEHTAKAFLGLTFNCAHCHDHKYDPITQEDYFRLRAFFEPLELRQDRTPGQDPGLFQKYSYSTLRKVVREGLVRVFDDKLDARTFMYHRGDERSRMDRPPVSPGVPAFLGGKLRVEPIDLPPPAYYPGLKSFVQQEELAKRTQAVVAAQEATRKAGQDLEQARRRLAYLAAMPEAGRSLVPPVYADAEWQAETALFRAESAVALGALRARLARAEELALRARIEADQEQYSAAKGQGAGNVARQASKRERETAAIRAEETLLIAEQALAATKRQEQRATPGPQKDQAAAAVKKAEPQVAAAKKGLETARQALAADGTKYTPLSPVYPAKSTGRRSALARWLTSTDNPLTARVAANHIWLRHFGKPLVESVYDFGRNGKPPSHPELLDWLAVELMTPSGPTAGSEGSWSMKRLHRLIVLSQAYRQSSGARPDHPNRQRDGANRYLWQHERRRVEAETVRDSLLHVAGELDLRVGGPPVEERGELASRRRSLYFAIHPENGGTPPFLGLFDAPDPCDCYRRTETTIPQQALALTNSQLVQQVSKTLAPKLWQDVAAASEAAFVTAAFEHLLSRQPADSERDACLAFLEKQMDVYRNNKPALTGDLAQRARESLLRALLNHDDFVSIR